MEMVLLVSACPFKVKLGATVTLNFGPVAK